MAAGKRITVWPGSDLDGLARQPIPFDHNDTPDNLTSSGRKTSISDEGTSQGKPKGKTGIFTSRLAPYKVPSTHVAGDTHPSRSNPPLSSPVTEKRSNLGDGDEASKSKRQRSDPRTETPLQPIYHEFMNLEQAGLAVMGCDNTRERNLVAIKRLKGVDKTGKSMMRPFTTSQVVGVKDMFFDNADLVIIYEQMHVSLRQVTGILQAPLQDFQIAAICKELVGGLAYIHKKLSLYHGDLNCGEIILNCDGMVKIANVGESFARGRHITTKDRRKDVRSVGFVMMELMEPTTYMLNPHSTELQNSERWRDGSGIKDFLGATQHHSLEQLTMHDFLPRESLAKCLKAHVFCALWAAETKWDILSLP